MTWTEIGKSNLQAAKGATALAPRSSASRAYYAAHAVLTVALLQSGGLLPIGRQTFHHADQPRLIGRHLSHLGVTFVRDARLLIRRLYSTRIDADYRRTVTVDHASAVEAVRDAAAFFRLLGVK
jgi:hypothetical protein